MTRPSPLVLVALILLGAAASVSGQLASGDATYTIEEQTRTPAASFVGDLVELRYLLRPERSEDAAALRAPETLPAVPWGALERIRVMPRDDRVELILSVRPFEPGTLLLPPIRLGPVVLTDLTLVVSSVLGDGEAVEPVYGPQVIPGTRALFVTVAFLVTLPVSLLLFLLGPGRALVARFVDWRHGRAPHRAFLRELDRLEASIKLDTAREFYTNIVLALQELMSARLGFDCHAATSSELRLYLPALAARCGAPASVARPLEEIITSADQAKFGHDPIRRRVRRAHLASARAIATDLELARRHAGRPSGGEGRRHAAV